MRISGGSSPSSVGSAMVRFLEAGALPVMVAIGAGPINQAVKSLIVADNFVRRTKRRVLGRFVYGSTILDNPAGQGGEPRPTTCIEITPVLVDDDGV